MKHYRQKKRRKVKGPFRSGREMLRSIKVGMT
jgi:hypothetical protein